MFLIVARIKVIKGKSYDQNILYKLNIHFCYPIKKLLKKGIENSGSKMSLKHFF